MGNEQRKQKIKLDIQNKAKKYIKQNEVNQKSLMGLLLKVNEN